MLMTGKEYLESIRDGRRVYVGSELVEDVTAHPAFRNAAASFAMIYDRKGAAENRDVMTVEEDGDRFSAYYLLPRDRDDLMRRFETHRRIASWTHGLLGRSPDNFPSYVSGLVMDPAMFDAIRPGFGDNIRAYYRHMRRNDIFAAHTVTNPQGWKPTGPAEAGKERVTPTLRVVKEDDKGVVINGLKMLGTAAVFCHETWCGNLQPVAPGHEKEAITCAVKLNAPGVTIWSRKPFERYAVSAFDNPLTARFDETDSAVLFENVHVPWERVFCVDDIEMTRAIYMRTPGHAMANHQANVRFLEKLKLIVGIARKLVDVNNVGHIPAVQSTLGQLAAMTATLEGLIMGQLHGEEMTAGYRTVNRRYVYAALHWCTNNHSAICDIVRELMGGGVFQMPADSSVLSDPKLRETFEAYWSVPGQSAKERMKLFKLAWDLLGSDFAGRHMQYEKFYAGPSFVMNAYSYFNAPWQDWTGAVDALMASYDAGP